MCAEIRNALGEDDEPMRRQQGQNDTLVGNTLLCMSMHRIPAEQTALIGRLHFP